jgi:zinc transporter 1
MTTLYVVAEIGVAVYLDSLALLSDGFHNFGDLVALGIAYWCEQNKNRMAGVHYTYGFKRVEILGGLANGWSLMALCLYVVLESIPRFYHHIEIQGGATFITVAALGLAVNTIGTIIFARHGMSHGHSHGGHGHDHGHGGHELLHKPPGKKKESSVKVDRYGGTLDEASTTTSYFSAPSAGSLNDYPSDDDHHDDHHGHEHHGHAHHGDLNMRAVFLHYLGDSISSVAVLIEGILLSVTDGEWLRYIDPIFSLIIVGIIIVTTYPLLKQCSLLVLQVCPVDIDGVRRQLSAVQGVISVHELHIWTLTPGVVISTLHFATLPTTNVKGIQCEMRKILHHAGVHSSAIQVEYVEVETKEHKSASCIENCVADCDQEWCCNNDSDEL